MKKNLSILLMLIFVFGALFSITVVGAEENVPANKTTSQVSKTSETANQLINQSVLEDKTYTNNVTDSTVAIPTADQKFKVGPTVVLRPVNDVITKNEDGLIELYIDNPSLNNVTLNVDVRISVPAGIHVYGQDFAQIGAAGTAYGTFSVPPGTARTISIDFKGDKVGTSIVHFSGLYWPGENKDNYNPISLSHPFVVKEASENPDETPSSNDNGGVKAEGEGSFSAGDGGGLIFLSLIVILIIPILLVISIGNFFVSRKGGGGK